MGDLFISNKNFVFLLVVCAIGILTVTSAYATDLNGTDFEDVGQSNPDNGVCVVDDNGTYENYCEDSLGVSDNEKEEITNVSSQVLSSEDSSHLGSILDPVTPQNNTFSAIREVVNSNFNVRLDGVYNMEMGDSPIRITSVQVEIVGQPGTVIDGCGINSLFVVTTDALSVVFRNIIFKNGVGNNGGAVSIEYRHLYQNMIRTARVTFENCIFINNHATSGGAIYGYGSAKNCVFINNTATNDGGANYLFSATNCAFINNSAVNGGATFKCKSTDCNFTGNSATNGGAIYDGNVENCKFINNSATNGGAIFLENNDFVISDCLFDNDLATNRAGSVYIKKSSNGLINNSHFVSCFANNEGNAIYWDEGNGLTLCSSSFEGCASPSGSQYIKFYDGAVEYDVYDCLFDVAPAGITYYYTSKLNVTSLKVYEGEKGALAANLTNIFGPISSKKVNYVVDGKTYSFVTDSNGFAKFDFTDYFSDIKCYDVLVSFEGYDNIQGVSTNTFASIIPLTKFKSLLNASDLFAYKGEDAFITVNLSDARGPLSDKIVSLNVSGNVYSDFTNSEGLVSFNIKNYLTDVGMHYVNITFGGDDFDDSSIKQVKVDLDKYHPIINVTDILIYKGEENFLRGSLSNIRGIIPNKKVNFTINCANYTEDTNSEGYFTIDLNNFFTEVGNYKIMFSFDGDDFNHEIIKEIKVNLTKRNSSISFGGDIRFGFANKGSTFIRVSGGSIDLDHIHIIQHPEANITLENGIITVSKLSVGVYELLVESIPDENHFSKTAIIQVIVTSNQVKLTYTNDLIFDYGKSDSTTVDVRGGVLDPNRIKVIGQENKAKISFNNNKITVSGLDVGNYILNVVTIPNEGYYEIETNISITVNKVIADIQVSKFSEYYKSGKTWTVKLYDSKTKSPLSNFKVTVRFYTGNNFKTYEATTNSKGIATFKASNWATGKHKVVVTSSKIGYDFKPVTTTIEIKKPTKLSITAKPKSYADGSLVSFWVKANKKPINNLKMKLYVYSTSKKYRVFNLVTGKFKDNSGKINYGYVAYGTNKLSVGAHKVVLKVNDIRYTGTATTKIIITKGMAKFQKTTHIVSKGKRQRIY